MHADFAIRAARAGKHVMVEKPLAVSEDEALAMIAAARAANVFLMTAYRLHNEPGTVAVLEHIRANAIGRPLFFQSVFSFQTAMGNHRLKASTWGGPLQDVGVYCINAARHIFAEEPIEAMAMSYRPEDDPRFGDIDASVAATLRFPSGGLAQFVASFGAAAVDNYRVVGTSGDLELDPGFKFDTVIRLRLRRDGKIIETEFPQIDHFGAQVGYFSDCMDQANIAEVEAALVSSRLRLQTTQVTWQHFRNPIGSGIDKEDVPKIDPKGPGPGPGPRPGGEARMGDETALNLVELSIYGIASLYERPSAPKSAAMPKTGGTAGKLSGDNPKKDGEKAKGKE